MADIEVWAVQSEAGRVQSMKVRFKGTAERVISRDTALRWLEQGHSLILYSGSAHHGHRGESVERVEVAGDAYLRTDMDPVPEDHVSLSADAHH